MLRKAAVLAYSAANYALFLAVFLYLACFFGNFLVPKTIDSGAPPHPAVAVTVDVLLVALFGLQHSIMARPGFKRVWTRLVPRPIERSTYLLFSSLALILLILLWQPLPLVLWDVTQPVLAGLLWTLFAIGWLGVPLVSLMIDHFDLFGLRQAWLHATDRPDHPRPLITPYLYGIVRHPLYIAWAIAFWATPTMTAGHALLAGLLTLYMLIAVRFEERDLVAHFGADYEAYRERVGMFVPRAKRPRQESEITRTV
jgi:protein-S-isoprenylcysteine O-methyltransferase Ste14